MTHVEDVLKKYPSSLFDQGPDSNIGKKWQAELDLLNESFTVLEGIRGISDYRNQSGAILDLIGKNLKQARNGTDDFRYRVFLAIARQKIKSKGDIFSMNEIGTQILAGTGTLYEIRELCYGGVPMLLDGNLTLNGDYPLSGSTKRPATIRVIFNGHVDSLIVAPEFNLAISQIRAGGVRSIISYRFEISTLDGRLYGSALRPLVMDGTWDWNGSTLLSGENVKILPYEIAFGSSGLGELRTPQPEDTGLQNEVFRKLVEIQINLDGSRIFKTTIRQSELVGYDVDEIGLFDEEGNLLFLKSFPAKSKDNLILYEFVIREEFL
ncbi:phage tail protein [Leptospira sp. 201903070]|uniref:Phage tail protein n=1 Tax=Leptospira ainlahdjerensis TaxID=2810033 RepID=A0ABS2U9B9_9LEPT|nr:phage tail protein [Leptospira ainlahdjerensis]MBM9576963.1 phage tail protein [Leptospira ainlahdjerensis]